jgi:hypothetical protein
VRDDLDTAVTFHARVRSRPQTLRPSIARTNVTGRRVAIALAATFGVAMIAFVVIPNTRVLFDRGTSKEQVAKHTLHAYVHQALPAWRMATSRACPNSIGELSAFIGRRDAIDMWGKPFAMYCTSASNGDPTIVVRSAGEDTTFGTADDLWSDR